jgi:hypothetical protein
MLKLALVGTLTFAAALTLVAGGDDAAVADEGRQNSN